MRRSIFVRSVNIAHTHMASLTLPPSSLTRHTTLQLIECPRDAMQGLRDFVETKDKIRYINQLLKVGFHTVDFGSFVSAPAVPQMRDTAEVLQGLEWASSPSKLLVIVANIKGAVKACTYDAIHYIGYPLSVSETFQRKNTNRGIEEAFQDVVQLHNLCAKNKKELVIYISMAFGNPYGEEYLVQNVIDLVGRVAALGVKVISLADTVGISTVPLIENLFTHLIPKYPDIRFGAHFHSGAVSSQAKVEAAVRSGCCRLDSAMGGMGGCPFAKSTLIGNIATEAVIETLEKHALPHGLNKEELKKCGDLKHEIFGVAVKEILLASVLKNEKNFFELCRSHFERADKHRLGYLALPEFGEAMCQVFAELGNPPPTQERIERAFKKLDIVENGVVTLDEYMIGARRLLKKRLLEIDPDHPAENIPVGSPAENQEKRS